MDDDYRFYFQIDGETYLLLSILTPIPWEGSVSSAWKWPVGR